MTCMHIPAMVSIESTQCDRKALRDRGLPETQIEDGGSNQGIHIDFGGVGKADEAMEKGRSKSGHQKFLENYVPYCFANLDTKLVVPVPHLHARVHAAHLATKHRYMSTADSYRKGEFSHPAIERIVGQGERGSAAGAADMCLCVPRACIKL